MRGVGAPQHEVDLARDDERAAQELGAHRQLGDRREIAAQLAQRRKLLFEQRGAAGHLHQQVILLRRAEITPVLSAPEQDDLLMEVARRTALFEGSFPPLRELRRDLSPIAELSMRAELLGGSLVVSGKVDLVLGRPDTAHPTRAQRLLIDLKTGGAYPEHAEDNRAYALLHTLRFGVPPYRVASFFLEGGTWQAEDVHEELLFHAADRVIATARAAASLRAGRDPLLTPGRWCNWCPRADVCPAADPDATAPVLMTG